MLSPCPNTEPEPDEIGQLVDNFTTKGRVTAVYDQAANILIPQGILVTLVARTRQMTPLSVKFTAAFDLSGSRQGRIHEGDHVQIKPGRLTIGRVHMDLKKRPRFQGMPDHNLCGCMGVDKINRFHRALTMLGRPGGFLGLIEKKPDDSPFVRKGLSLCRLIFNDPGPQMAVYLAKFAGLGVGLTPSGDDLLCGFLLGESISLGSAGPDTGYRSLSGPTRLDDVARTVIWQAAGRTTDAGRTLIWLALKGRCPAYLLDAAAGLANARTSSDIFKAIAAAVDCGKTSGTDALVGLLLYFQLFHRRGLLE